MANDPKPTSVSLSKAAEGVLDYIRSQIPTYPSKSSTIDALLLGEISLDDYNIPDELKVEIEAELETRRYKRKDKETG